jgi:hypothetical protein
MSRDQNLNDWTGFLDSFHNRHRHSDSCKVVKLFESGCTLADRNSCCSSHLKETLLHIIPLRYGEDETRKHGTVPDTVFEDLSQQLELNWKSVNP